MDDRSSSATLALLPRKEETFSLGRKINVSFSVFFWENIQTQVKKKNKNETHTQKTTSPDIPCFRSTGKIKFILGKRAKEMV